MRLTAAPPNADPRGEGGSPLADEQDDRPAPHSLGSPNITAVAHHRPVSVRWGAPHPPTSERGRSDPWAGRSGRRAFRSWRWNWACSPRRRPARSEHRHRFGGFTPDLIIQAGLGADVAARAARGSSTVDEVYGELRLPPLRDRPVFHLLEPNGAARH